MSAAGSSADGAVAPSLDLRANIAALKEQAKELKTTKMQVNKALRNAEKKRARLKRKARELTDADLLQVIKLRQDEQSLKDEKTVSAEDPAAAKATAGCVTAATAGTEALAMAAPAGTASVVPEPTETGGRDEDLTE